MIVCSCAVITSEEIHRAIAWMRAADPDTIITPGKVYRALGKRPDCGGCVSLFVATMRADRNTAVALEPPGDIPAERRGVRFHAETCPHYLLFGKRDLARPEGRGAEFIVMPCLRTAHDRERLWRALADGEIDLVSSDHSPSHRLAAVRAAAAGTPFTELPGGCPGLRLRAPLLFSHGVMAGRLSPGRFAELIAERPAALFGLAGKGRLAVGADADLVLWDPEREVTVDRAMMHDGVDFTPYAGQRLRGWPAAVVSRGEIVVRDGVLAAQPGRGRFTPMRPCAADSRPAAAAQ